ncbi:cation diffusion facilitator family transporter [soil metagenome]
MSTSRKTIYVAILANAGIAAAKIVGFVFTSSSAMLSEAIHSLVDCGNGGLLLLGQRLSSRPPDRTHPFGYGKELYFWSLIVALLIFVLGGGISIAEGIDHIRHPKAGEDAIWAYGILGVSILFETYSFVVSIKEFKLAHPGLTIMQGIKVSKDPSGFTVIYEDAAALMGLITALVGIFLSHTFGWLRADGIASVVIGSLLIGVAVLLIVKCKTLLIGESGDDGMLQTIRGLAQADPDIDKAGYPFTMYFGPHTVLLTMNVQFRKGLAASETEASIDRVETAIREAYPDVRHIYLEADSLRDSGSERGRYPGRGFGSAS